MSGSAVPLPREASVPSLEVTPNPWPAVADCPDRPFDAAAPLGPEFEQDVFLHDESADLARAFLAALGALYAARPGSDPCDTFTARGFAEALAFDPRLAAAQLGRATIDGLLVLRLRSEGSYDLRARPPTVPLDLIFDLPAGSRLTDRLAGNAIRVSTTVQRFGLGVELQFDGRVWRADRVGPVSADSQGWARLPVRPPPGPPCTNFRRDPAGTPFDEAAGPPIEIIGGAPRRRWCDEGGAGGAIPVPELLSFTTQFPCGRGRVAILSIGQPVGAPLDPLVRWEYMRDPDGEALAANWLTAPWQERAVPPPDAVATGWTNGNVDLWVAPSDRGAAIYLVRGGTVERWPRAAEFWGVTDCN
jgi:hypothetical protein